MSIAMETVYIDFQYILFETALLYIDSLIYCCCIGPPAAAWLKNKLCQAVRNGSIGTI